MQDRCASVVSNCDKDDLHELRLTRVASAEECGVKN